MVGSDHSSAPLKRRRWATIALATLLAFLCQSFVTQTHWDPDPVARSVALAASGSTSATLKAGQPAPAPICPICREIAQAGFYLPPVQAALLASEPGAIWRVTLPPRALAPNQSSHAWRSRAPPRLQA
ncbi:MAG: hypothetical protein V4475_02050 [Pseudomonadota bacterium]